MDRTTFQMVLLASSSRHRGCHRRTLHPYPAFIPFAGRFPPHLSGFGLGQNQRNDQNHGENQNLLGDPGNEARRHTTPPAGIP